MHRTLAISCCLLATLAAAQSSRRSADPAMKAPTVNTNPNVRHAAERRVFQGVPTLERTPDGRLWAAWIARTKEKVPDCHVVLVTSDNGGAAWSKPALVIDPPGVVCAFDPCLWLDPEGLLWLFWAQSSGLWDGRGGVWCITCEDWQSKASTWSRPRRLCNGVMINKPTVLRSGEWLLPVSVWADAKRADTASTHPHHLGEESGANVVVSRDLGLTFNLRGQVRVPQREYDEHQIIERRDGSLWMLVRTPHGIAESDSTDRGRTWSAARPSGIPHVNSRFCIRRLKSGSLLLITNEPPDGKARSHLIAHVSIDDGRTWRGGLMLDDRAGVSYPDAVEDDGGVIRVIYDFERTKAKQILMAQFNERNILSGRRSSTTRLRVVVSKAGPAANTSAEP